MVGLPIGENIFKDIYNRLHTMPAYVRQTGRQTDGQTTCDGIVRAMHTSLAVEMIRVFTFP